MATAITQILGFNMVVNKLVGDIRVAPLTIYQMFYVWSKDKVVGKRKFFVFCEKCQVVRYIEDVHAYFVGWKIDFYNVSYLSNLLISYVFSFERPAVT